MKKLVSVLLCALLLSAFTALPFSVSAATSTGMVDAVQASVTPKIDGIEDDVIWAYANSVDVVNFGSNIFAATSTPEANETNPVAYATVKIAWDRDYIYCFANVYDSTPNGASTKDTPEDCDIDSVDFQISEEGYGIDQSMRDDTVGSANSLPGNGIFNVNINGKITGWGGVWCADNGDQKVSGTAVTTSYGYDIEIAIPLQTITGKLGTVVGMEFQINDNQDGSGRTAIRQWSCDECQAHSNTIYLGKVTFVDAPVIETEAPATEAPAADTAASEPAAAPQTFDILIAASVAALASAVVIKKRR